MNTNAFNQGDCICNCHKEHNMQNFINFEQIQKLNIEYVKKQMGYLNAQVMACGNELLYII